MVAACRANDNPEYEDTDDEWQRDSRHEIRPLNDVAFLIQRTGGYDRGGDVAAIRALLSLFLSFVRLVLSPSLPSFLIATRSSVPSSS